MKRRPLISRLAVSFIALSTVAATVLGYIIMLRPPSQIKFIYVVPMSHLDIGFTAPSDDVAQLHKDILDGVIQNCLTHSDFNWTIETNWQLEQWLRRTSDQQQIDQLFNLIKEERISVGAIYANEHSGLLGHEEVNRLLYPAKYLQETYGINISTAIMNDIPGYSWALPQVFSKSGVHYFLTGVNLGYGGGITIPIRDIPFYWKGPDGSKILTWISYNSYTEGIKNYHLDSNYIAMSQGVNRELTKLGRERYPYDAIIVLHAYDNADSTRAVRMLNNVRRWNNEHKSPKIIISTPEKFFEHMEDKYSGQIPTYSGDWSGVWERVKLRVPQGNAMVRWTHDHATIAEKVWSINSLLSNQMYPSSEIDNIYKNMLVYDEHTQAGVGWPRMMTKDEVERDNFLKFEIAKSCYDGADSLLSSGLQTLITEIQTDNRSILVFNPLSWERTDIVRIKLSSAVFEQNFGLKDCETSTFVPYQKYSEIFTIEFVAERVPSIGYKKYEIIPSQTQPEFGQRVNTTENTIENDFYAVKIDPSDGHITSIFDKEAQKELINGGSTFDFNSLIKVANGKTDTTAVPTETTSITNQSGPISGKIVIERENSPLKKTEITLYSNIKRIDITNVVDRNKMDFVPYNKHSEWYYFTFPFNFSTQSLKTKIEIANTFLSPTEDYLPGAHRGSFTSQHCVSLLDEDSYGVTIANKQAFLSEFGSITWPGVSSATFSPSEATLISAIMAKFDQGETKDLGVANITVEPGADPIHIYEYSLTSNLGRFNPVHSSHFGWSFDVPLLAKELNGGQQGLLKSPSLSFFGLDKQNVIIINVKKAEFGDPNDFIFRLQEIAGNQTSVELSSFFNITKAEENNNIEENIDGPPLPINPIQFSIGPYQTLTLRTRFGNVTPADSSDDV